jgi:hypothetical protein
MRNLKLLHAAASLVVAGGAWGATLIDQQYILLNAYNVGQKTATSLTLFELQTGLTGMDGSSVSGHTIIRPNQGVGAWVSATVNGMGASGEVRARSRTTFHVVSAGTFSLPVVMEGSLAIPAAGMSYRAIGTQVVTLETTDGINGWWIPAGMPYFEAQPRVVRDIDYGYEFEGHYGLAAGEYSYTTGAMTWQANRTLSATLMPGDYALFAWTEGMVNARFAAGGTAVFDSLNSVGVDGSDFWSAVSGTAVFYDPANPSIGHNIPEPAGWWMTAALVLARRRGAGPVAKRCVGSGGEANDNR